MNGSNLLIPNKLTSISSSIQARPAMFSASERRCTVAHTDEHLAAGSSAGRSSSAGLRQQLAGAREGALGAFVGGESSTAAGQAFIFHVARSQQ